MSYVGKSWNSSENGEGDKSTDLQSPETVEHLCGKCSEYAKEWAGVADKIWKETDYKKPSYENYKK